MVGISTCDLMVRCLTVVYVPPLACLVHQLAVDTVPPENIIDACKAPYFYIHREEDPGWTVLAGLYLWTEGYASIQWEGRRLELKVVVAVPLGCGKMKLSHHV